ncbi:NAD-dependent epimerase [Algoriphagus aquimarinus]|uniref:UDP-glucuronate 4-epimerase n=1 Tax=Algoriphagus aquimarinus TaxID=237018 RepID=A0A1I1C1U7_9BACT|nr:NAD-dependent epimerase [Algoriphagus aquimarinus]SFB56511.1 UDP-glucuronate 4-epimerase [Algoriphagus aquimarinus]|tara:strand:- start:10205 stop:11257 length:1053 start_codon:yes stop_codon:yes gene_type:complete
MKYLVTGTAGFIGFHVAQQLLERGDEVVGLDIINDYYDINLKYARLAHMGIQRDHVKKGEMVQSDTISGYRFIQLDLSVKDPLVDLFAQEKFDVVIHLAAQAGVRYSLSHPEVYIESNIVAYLNILEACRFHPVKHLVYASSSSVYGSNEKMPFSTSDSVDHPISLYAASKKSNELMAHTYSHLFNIPTTGLRFFTVYGPWGRPDMALFLFTEAILKDEPIQVFNYGNMKRDFTYIDDIVKGVIKVADRPASPNAEFDSQNPDPGSSKAPYKVYNIGNSSPVLLMDYIHAVEKGLGKEAKMNMLPLQPGDVPASHAEVSDLVRDTGYKPDTPIDQGVKSFTDWYLDYYKK